MARFWTSLGALLVVAGSSRAAFAQPLEEIVYDNLHSVKDILPGNKLPAEIADAYIRVPPLDDGETPAQVDPLSMGGGSLHLRANVIHVQEGAILSVSGKGYEDVAGMDGGGPGGGKFLDTQAGGGAGAVGLGGVGSGTPACDGLGGAGGPIAVADPQALTLATLLHGSAGGAGSTSMVTEGGSGGGILILEASLVQIEGTLEARGAPSVSNILPGGGGAGGMIYIKSRYLRIGPNAVISAAGGNGLNSPAGNITGGGGGGGVIILESDWVDGADPRLVVDGGASEGCPSLAAAQGATGQVVVRDGPGECFDLDKDGYAACDLQGLEVDCNDLNAAVNEDAAETCDPANLDDDCNGKADWEETNQEAICGNDQACKKPVLNDAGELDVFGTCGPADPEEQEKPTETETVFFGGCGVGTGKPVAALTLAAFAAALLARWRRRSQAS